MSGHHSFDHTVHEGNIWLGKIAERLHFDDHHHAYSALRATLHVLRDRLQPQSAVHLSAQMPMVVRGLFFEGWKMAATPSDDDTVEAFCGHVTDKLPPKFPMDGRTVTEGVFAVLWSELDMGQTAKIIDQLPTHLHILWPAAAKRG
ncbi:MAG TPA: DUF2267 domain-containing protein [Devosia sp.]|nr:DUF2267 domain-containing protein [Devosia sp.]